MPGRNTFSCYIEGQQYFLCAENNEVFLVVSSNTSYVKWPNVMTKLTEFQGEKLSLVHLTDPYDTRTEFTAKGRSTFL